MQSFPSLPILRMMHLERHLLRICLTIEYQQVGVMFMLNLQLTPCCKIASMHVLIRIVLSIPRSSKIQFPSLFNDAYFCSPLLDFDYARLFHLHPLHGQKWTLWELNPRPFTHVSVVDTNAKRKSYP